MKRVGWILFFSLVVAPIFAQDIAMPPENAEPAMPPAPSIDVPAENSPATPSATKGNAKKKVVYKEKSYYDFEDVLINGNLRKPDGSFIFRKNQTNFSSALNLKRSFIPELKESATNAR